MDAHDWMGADAATYISAAPPTAPIQERPDLLLRCQRCGSTLTLEESIHMATRGTPLRPSNRSLIVRGFLCLALFSVVVACILIGLSLWNSRLPSGNHTHSASRAYATNSVFVPVLSAPPTSHLS